MHAFPDTLDTGVHVRTDVQYFCPLLVTKVIEKESEYGIRRLLTAQRIPFMGKTAGRGSATFLVPEPGRKEGRKGRCTRYQRKRLELELSAGGRRGRRRA